MQSYNGAEGNEDAKAILEAADEASIKRAVVAMALEIMKLEEERKSLVRDLDAKHEELLSVSAERSQLRIRALDAETALATLRNNLANLVTK